MISIVNDHQSSFNFQKSWFRHCLSENKIFTKTVIITFEEEIDNKVLEESIKTIIFKHPLFVLNIEGYPPLFKHTNKNQLNLTTLKVTLEQSAKIIENAKKKEFSLDSDCLYLFELLTINQQSHILYFTFPGALVDELWIDSFAHELIKAYSKGSNTGIDYFLNSSKYEIEDQQLPSEFPFDEEMIGLQFGQINTHFNLLPVNRTIGNYHTDTVPLILEKKLLDQLKELATNNGIEIKMLLLSAITKLLLVYTNDKEIFCNVRNSRNKEGDSHQEVVIKSIFTETQDIMFIEYAKTINEYYTKAAGFSGIPTYLYEDIKMGRVFQQPTLNVHFNSNLEKNNTIKRLKSNIYYKLENYNQNVDINFIFDFDLEKNLIEFHSEKYDKRILENISNNYVDLLEMVVKNPLVTVNSLHFVKKNEMDVLLEWGNNAASDLANSEHFVIRFEKVVERYPDLIALNFGELSITYNDLNKRANRLARYLKKDGIGPEVTVGICLDRSEHLIISIIAILKAGAAYVPLDPMSGKQRIDYIISDSNCKLCITDSNNQDRIKKTLSTIKIEEVIDELLEESDENLIIDYNMSNLAYIIYTSGSTGKPKGVQVEHLQVSRLIRSADLIFEFNEKDVWTLFHSYAFDFSVWEIFGCILSGGKLVIVPYRVSRSPKSFIKLLNQEKVTILNQTPSAFRQLMLNSDIVKIQNLSLRYIVFGGEKIDVTSITKWMFEYGDKKPELINMYGITEITVHATFKKITREDCENKVISIGKPLPDLSIYLTDKDLKLVPIGAIGEICIAGSGVTRGYRNQPERTHYTFVENPFNFKKNKLYRSGDLGRWLPNGELDYITRGDKQVKLNGYRIELEEIEHIISSFKSVVSTLVCVRKNKVGLNILVSYIVLESSGDFEEGCLRAFLKEQLPGYMNPSLMYYVDFFPTTENGKIDISKLPFEDK